ncbi:MAG: GDP-L-fucose synthase [Candidatus Accumulibacter regalis]|uniref:GDP-L-fucose synthase n=1 Tax=Accumulibacter regalis TaxID=522306 RepID=A0A011R8U5_ACCRE|nr:GDP-L-fucose synthase [Accumulibacter sp.]EXI87559.1 MAG: GDP-L-fucose synthase [Candidatus Accumulibacter regalis]HRE69587.1 GDP-L-fucose synthase [Accumulibacter sp.]
MSEPRIYVAGHRGMVGSAIARVLERQGHTRLVTRSRAELDLCDQAGVRSFFAAERPEQVYVAAARVGGIYANSIYPAEFIYQNLMIEANVIHEAWRVGVQKLMFLGSSCIYPRLAIQPMREDALFTGPLEPTNEPYAIAKIAGIKLCESYNRQYQQSHGTDYRCVMPTNLYGPGDNYDLLNSHVVPAVIRKLHLAKLAAEHNWLAIERDERIHGAIPGDLKRYLYDTCTTDLALRTTLWGSGTPKREFLYVDDLATACVHVMNLDRATYTAHARPMLSHINVGCGEEITVSQLAESIRKAVGYPGEVDFDPSKPDGAPRKLLDSTHLTALGWRAQVGLEEGLARAYADYLARGAAA